LEQRQKDFEKYKKKQERNLIQKTQELDKRSRALLNIPDRKQRTKIQELEKVIADLKLEFVEKEKRHKSKLERLKKQNKKLKNEKDEIEKEMKKFEQERLEFWKTKNDAAQVVQKQANQQKINSNVKQQQQPKKQKKKYSIAKIDAKRPKSTSNQFMRRSSNMQYAATMAQAPKTMVNRSTNNMYEQYQQQSQQQTTRRPMTSPYQALHVDMSENAYASSSSDEDLSSSSDESTKNGEGEEDNVRRHQTKQIVVEHAYECKKEESESVPPPAVNNHLPQVPAIYDPSKMTTEQINCECVCNPDCPLERMQHPDGKIEQVYADGSKLILFPNETQKFIFANLGTKGKQIYVKFPNGDVKKVLFDGSEVYYYAKNNIIHATKTDDIELFFFEGQHEVHFPDKTKHIQFADGTKKYIYPNGDEQCVFPENE